MALEEMSLDEQRDVNEICWRVRKRAWISDIQGKEKFHSLMAPTSALGPAPSNVKRGPHSAYAVWVRAQQGGGI
jgi:hypothetical protein